MEKRILAFWADRDIFRRSISQREGNDEFVFYDGPPFATGLPHFGHLVPGTIKDIIPRYRTMKGYKVDRRFGWDCHGLPVEYEMEKELGNFREAGYRGVRNREIQRELPLHRPALHERMALDHHPVGAMGRFRQ